MSGARAVSVWLLAIATGGPSTSHAGDVSYEPFDAYNLDQTLSNSAQPAPPAATGMADYTSNNQFLTWKPRAGSLALGVPFATSGAKLQVASGGVAMIGDLDLTGGNWTPYNGGSGPVGSVDGTTLYMSLLIQIIDPADIANNQCVWQLQQSGAGRFTVGQTWGASTYRAGANLGIPLDAEVHLVVVKIQYQSGDDAVSVYWNPDPAAPEPATATSTQTRNMTFDEIMYKGQRSGANGFYVDEIRFGTSWEAVTPIPATTWTLTVSAGANGSVYTDPGQTVFNDGDTVYVEAEGNFGYRFDGWTGDVPTGSENDSRLTLTMDQARTLTANFAPGVADFFTFDPGVDSYAASPIDLRSLNEAEAGASGWVTRRGDDFLLGDGRRVRFWAATVKAIDDPGLGEMARFLAKRGVNMVRWHTSLYNNGAANLSDANAGAVDDLQRMVTRMKAQGIYTKASLFFILGLRMQAGWGIDGYDAPWIAANTPGDATAAPFGLQFFDEDFKDAYKNWVSVLFTTPNPYNGGVPLKDDPALAIIEVQNEDNLFFWTFNPDRYPVVQQQKLDGLFGAWLTAKYGSVAAAQAAWGAVAGSISGRDDPPAGRMTVASAWFMTTQFTGGAGDRARMSDQIQFLLKLQRDWYVEMIDYMKNTLGCGQLFTASNWKTADDTFLQDGEYYTYTAADIIDSHNYFSPRISDRALFAQVSGGDDFFGIPGVNNPRTLPTAYKQTEGHPSMISESTWVNPSNFKSEGALLTAAYGSLIDLDSFFWFSSSKSAWQDGVSTWEFATPMIGGTFPGAALLYRRGDVTEAPVVVREGRTMASIGAKERSLMVETRGWDPTRDPDQEFDYDPSTGAGQVDSLATLVGKVEIAFDGEADFVRQDLGTYIDEAGGSVRSVTGELDLRWGQVAGANPPSPQAGEGRFTIDAPRAQAACGWLGAAGTLALENAEITMSNDWGCVLVISLDDAPLRYSSKVLIQAATREHLRRWHTNPKVLNDGGADYLGEEIANVGDLPWQVEGIDAQVNLVGMGAINSVQALDGNGHPVAALPASNPITLPSQALYTVVELTPPAGMSYGMWDAFTPLQQSDPAVGAMSANPDRDPYDNYTEYVFDTDPTEHSQLPISWGVVTADVGEGPQQFFQVEYDIRTDDPDVTHVAEVSNDLSTWRHNGDGSGETYTETVSATPNGDGTTRYVVRFTDPVQPGAAPSLHRLRWKSD